MNKIKDIFGNVLEFTGNKDTMNQDELDLVNGYQNGAYTVYDISNKGDLNHRKLKMFAFAFALQQPVSIRKKMFAFETANGVIVSFIKLPKNSKESKKIQNLWRLKKHTISVSEID